jgi:dipicolinate synthase subunit B
MCGSFCTHDRALKQLERLVGKGYEVQPILSETVYTTDTRFGRAQSLIERVEGICHHSIIHTVVAAEPLGPQHPLAALVICPCTGNTLAKLSCGITDTAVCMAAKAHLRTDRPLVLALASNDALSANLKNIAALLSRKGVYFVPMVQDDPAGKPHSMVADLERVVETLENALSGVQPRKLIW